MRCKAKAMKCSTYSAVLEAWDRRSVARALPGYLAPGGEVRSTKFSIICLQKVAQQGSVW